MGTKQNAALACLWTAGLLMVALIGLPWVREKSSSLAADFVLILVWALVAFAASWFQIAFFLPSTASQGGIFQKGTISRTLLVLMAVFGNLVWSNFIAGDFWFSHYSKIGVQATALRSKNPDTIRWAIGKIAESAAPHLEEEIRLLEPLLQNDDINVRADAIAAVGHISWRMRLAVRVLAREDVQGERFERRVLEQARRALGDPAGRVLQTQGKERLAWLYAAGCIGDASALPVLQRVIESGGTEEVIAAIDALADIGATNALAVLADIAMSGRGDISVRAGWALGLLMASAVKADGARVVERAEYVAAVSKVKEGLARWEDQALCAFLGWFPEIGDASLTEALCEVARSKRAFAECGRIERKRWFGTPEVVVGDNPMWELWLRAIGAIAVGNSVAIRCLEEVSGLSWVPAHVKERIRQLLEAARQVKP